MGNKDKPAHQWQTVCTLAELAPGEFVEFQIGPTDSGSDRLPPTGFLFLEGMRPKAYLNSCPHMGVELNWMPGRFMDTDKHFIQCSTHGALFKPGSGECIAGPCQGDALSALDIKTEEGAIQVRVPE